MRSVIQRVRKASVTVEGEIIGAIGQGLVVLVAVHRDDSDSDAAYTADKVAGLRIFGDADGKMNRSIADVGGSALIISQFTLFGDVRRGRRPSFVEAAPPEIAVPLYESVCAKVEAAGIPVQRGVFGAHMDLALLNDGPVTIQIDSRKQY